MFTVIWSARALKELRKFDTHDVHRFHVVVDRMRREEGFHLSKLTPTLPHQQDRWGQWSFRAARHLRGYLERREDGTYVIVALAKRGDSPMGYSER